MAGAGGTPECLVIRVGMLGVGGICMDWPVGARVSGWPLGSYSWHHRGAEWVSGDGMGMCTLSHGSERIRIWSTPLAGMLHSLLIYFVDEP